jgi:hypothetical protein
MIKFIFVPPYSFAIDKETQECVFCKCNDVDNFNKKFAKELLLARLDGDKDYEKWLIEQQYPDFKFGDKVRLVGVSLGKTLSQNNMTEDRAKVLMEYKNKIGLVLNKEQFYYKVAFEDGEVLKVSKNLLERVRD